MILSIVMLSTDEYSDYSTAPFRVLKPFTMRKALEEFKSKYQLGSCYDFSRWLKSNRYVEGLDLHDIHLGCYGKLDISEEDLDVEFIPSE